MKLLAGLKKGSLCVVAGVALVFAFSPSANADQYFSFNFAGAEGAAASGYVAFTNDAIDQIHNASYNYYSPTVVLTKGNGNITDFSITVSGARVGNGTFGFSTFDSIIWQTAGALDTNISLWHQRYTNPGVGGANFGMPGPSGFMFSSSTDPTAPASVSYFIIEPNYNAGHGSQLSVNSFAPTSDPNAAPEIDGKFIPQALLLTAGIGVLHRKRKPASKTLALTD